MTSNYFVTNNDNTEPWNSLLDLFYGYLVNFSIYEVTEKASNAQKKSWSGWAGSVDVIQTDQRTPAQWTNTQCLI